jgi:hypothetical protein
MSDDECERSLAVSFPNANDMTKILSRSLRRLWSDMFKIPVLRLLGGVGVGTKYQVMRSDTTE